MPRDPRDRSSRPHRAAQSTWGSASARRGFERIPVEGRARLTTGSTTYHSQTGNLSTGGVFLHMEAPPPVGEPVKVLIKLSGSLNVYVDGVVRWHEVDSLMNRLGCGVEFDQITDEQRLTIQQALAQVAQGAERLVPEQEQEQEQVPLRATGTA